MFSLALCHVASRVPTHTYRNHHPETGDTPTGIFDVKTSDSCDKQLAQSHVKPNVKRPRIRLCEGKTLMECTSPEYSPRQIKLFQGSPPLSATRASVEQHLPPRGLAWCMQRLPTYIGLTVSPSLDERKKY